MVTGRHRTLGPAGEREGAAASAEGQQVVAFIPARAGSKGIEHKNLQLLGDRTLLRWAIDTAHATPEIDRCVVSTDGEAIADQARRAGAGVHVRPEALADDDALVIDAIRHFLAVEREAGTHPDIVVLFEPTSPLRIPVDVRHCLEGLLGGADSAATVTEAALHPKRAFRIDADGLRPYIDGAVPWAPRQSLEPAAYQITGGVYAFWAERLPTSGPAVLFGTVHAVSIPRERCLDIDDPIDLERANDLLRRGAIPDLGQPAGP